jgi:hypothetical protein
MNTVKPIIQQEISGRPKLNEYSNKPRQMQKGNETKLELNKKL